MDTKEARETGFLELVWRDSSTAWDTGFSQKGRRKSVGKCKSVVTALLKPLYDEMYEKTPKNTASGPHKPSPDVPRTL